jgi:hypothetical protein
VKDYEGSCPAPQISMTQSRPTSHSPALLDVVIDRGDRDRCRTISAADVTDVNGS